MDEVDEIRDRIIEYFCKFGIEVKDGNSIINPNNILSDDANLIMGRFLVEFQINKGYLEIDKYFNPLPALNLKYFWNLITRNQPKKESKPKITVEHLIEVVRRKEWFDPE